MYPNLITHYQEVACGASPAGISLAIRTCGPGLRCQLRVQHIFEALAALNVRATGHMLRDLAPLFAVLRDSLSAGRTSETALDHS